MMQSSATRRSNWRESGYPNDRFDPEQTLARKENIANYG
jgi:hypothetical protein